MEKISVIMPSLNIKKYIDSCIKSVLFQTFTDLEIVVIDAGSTDGTWELLQEYAAKDERVRLIHSDKKSYGYQINLGISLAQGEYIGIVETDDMIVDNMYETLYQTAKETEAEYVKGCPIYYVDIGQNARWQKLRGIPCKDQIHSGEVVSPCDIPELLIQDIYLWTGIYQKDFLQGIFLNETPGAAFQDQGFLFQTISKAKKAVYLNQPVYLYRQDNIGSSIFNRQGFHYLVEEYAYIEKFLEDKDAAWVSAYYRRMFSQILGRFRTMAVSGTFWEEAIADMEILRSRLIDAVDNRRIRIEDVEKCNQELLILFIESVESVYKKYVREFSVKKEAVNKILNLLNGKQAVIFGCGGIGRFVHVLLEHRSVGCVAAYCDNSIELWNTEVQELHVLSPSEAVSRYPEAVYVITSLKSAKIIKKQLQGLGIIDKQICFYQEPENMLLLHV